MRELSGIPTAPGRRPFVGHALELRRRPVEFLHSLRGLGDFVRAYVGPLPVYVVTCPVLVHEILVGQANRFGKGRLFDKVRSFLGNGLLTSDGEFHHRQRRLMQPAFQRKRIAEHVGLMRGNAEKCVEQWRPRQVLEMQGIADQLALRNVAEALFSADLRPGAHEEVLRWLPVVVHGSVVRTLAPAEFLHRLPTPGNRRFAEADRRFRRVIDEVIESGRAGDGDRGDLLSMVLAARDEDTGRGMTDPQARDELVNLLLAGAETTASTLGSLFHHLSTHPAVQRRVHAELDEVLGGRPVDVEDVPKLEYTQQVVTEVLRLDQPVWLLMRRPRTEVNLGGVRFPPGVELLFSGSALHRDPDVYPDPLAFDPDRWQGRTTRELPAGSYIPFGAGNRRCIGDNFALTELVVTVATFCAGWRVEAAALHEPKRVYGILSRLDRVPLTVVPR